MTGTFRSLIVLAAVTLAGCSEDAMVARIMPAGADVRARAYLSLFVRGEVDSTAARLVPDLQRPAARVQLDEIAAREKSSRSSCFGDPRAFPRASRVRSCEPAR